MISIRSAVFLFGCGLMLLALLLTLGQWDHPRYGRDWLYRAGLLVSVGAMGWPEKVG